MPLCLGLGITGFVRLVYKGEVVGHIKRHKAGIHDIDVTYYLRNVEGCKYKVKHSSNLKPHEAYIHGVSHYQCNVDGCQFIGKHPKALRIHQAGIHGIDVTYYRCDFNGCEYEAKQSGNLKVHKKVVHGSP